MNRLPKDVLMHIISYTYSPQPKDLIHDIRSYKLINEVNDFYYKLWIVEWQEAMFEDRYRLINDLCFFLNDYAPLDEYSVEYYQVFRKVFRRLFRLRNCSDEDVQKLTNKIWQEPINRQINTVWGLMTVHERNVFYLRLY